MIFVHLYYYCAFYHFLDSRTRLNCINHEYICHHHSAVIGSSHTLLLPGEIDRLQTNHLQHMFSHEGIQHIGGLS